MNILKALRKSFDLIKSRVCLILWISLVIYLFYKTFIYYNTAKQFSCLREILGLGLCVSRGTASVINLCCALILLPMCKKLNQVWYRVLTKVWPAFLFYWLERAKSFHMTVATTMLFFSVIHSISHLHNLWSFSTEYNESVVEVNFASYKGESPMVLLMSTAGVTGCGMVVTAAAMGLTSLRPTRRNRYNLFWYTHQMYLGFIVLLIMHPMSGVLKQEVFDVSSSNVHNTTIVERKFVPIKTTTWLWMIVPLTCFAIDLIWRILSRNLAKVEILQSKHMAGRTLSLTLSCPNEQFQCRMGQFVLLQCPEVSLLEWHPFTVVQVPTTSQKQFVVWIRVKGDWTESVENLLLKRSHNISVFVDGPFSSPMEGVCRSGVAVCVAAGVGITPFVTTVQSMLSNPRGEAPKRIHLLWIVKHEQEITWFAEILNKTILELNDANRLDRLHLELYITNIKNDAAQKTVTQILVDNNKLSYEIKQNGLTSDEKDILLTPNIGRLLKNTDGKLNVDINYELAKEYPILGCRVKRGRPYWDRVFGYWVNLYPNESLDCYCCGPKNLVKLLRNQCLHMSRSTKTKFTFIHEGFC